MTTENTTPGPSGWYTDTGEGRAVAAGAEDLKGVDISEVLGQGFRQAVEAVIAVNTTDARPGADHFDLVRDTYQQKLTADQHRAAEKRGESR